MKKSNKLPKRIKDKWVKALNSGNYEQGDSALKKDNQYCCLGVLAEVCGVNLDHRVKGSPKGLAGFISDLPKTDKKNIPSILIDTTDSTYSINKLSRNSQLPHRLAYFNDNNRSFKWIAAYIKRYL